METLGKKSIQIHVACRNGNKSLLKKIILSGGCNVLEAEDYSGYTPLLLCVQHNFIDCAKLLIKAGVDVYHCNKKGQSVLHIAAIRGQHKFVKLLVEHKDLSLKKDFAGITPLHLAAVQANSKCLMYMLKLLRRDEVDIQDSSKKTALHWAAAYASVENIKQLLLKGANICIPDEGGKTPLHWAVLSKKQHVIKCIKILLDKEASLINWQDYEGRSPLHLAVSSSTVDVIRSLINRSDCNMDVLDNKFSTPLHWAAKKGLADVVDILLSRRDCHASFDANGATPLHYAVYFDHVETVQIFLSRNYVLDVEDKFGHTSLMWAAAKNSIKCMTMMAEKKIELKQVEKHGLSAFHFAAIRGQKEMVQFLNEEAQFPIDVKDEYGMTPFLRACQYGQVAVASYLLSNGADINARDMDNNSALHWSAGGGFPYLIQLLIHSGSDINYQDDYGKTALHYSVMKSGSLNCVCVLLESGADPNIADIEGKTALHWAVIRNHLSIIKLLCVHDADVNAMFLRNDWSTPLDLAVQMGYPKVKDCLMTYGGLKISEIKSYAASKIQIWYRKKLMSRICSSTSISDLNTSNLNENLLFIKQLHRIMANQIPSTLKKGFRSKIPIRVQNEEFPNEKIFLKQILSNSYPETKYLRYKRNSPNLSVNCLNRVDSLMRRLSDEITDFVSAHCVKSKAEIHEASAVVIQRCWKRYTLKRKFQRMKNNIEKRFKTQEQRNRAEKKWHLKLMLFCDDYEKTLYEQASDSE